MGYQQRDHKRRNKQTAAAKQAKRRTIARTARRYWLTPKVAAKPCSHCGRPGSVAYRASDRKRACRPCIDRLGITAHESTTWIEAGRKPYCPGDHQVRGPGDTAMTGRAHRPSARFFERR